MLANSRHEFDESNLPCQADLSINKDIDNPNMLEHIERVWQFFTGAARPARTHRRLRPPSP
jgi:hypothetical protein